MVATGGDAWPFATDLMPWAATRHSAEAAHARAGRLDTVVLGAGGFPKYVNLFDCPVEAWDAVVNLNLHSMFYLLKTAAPLMVTAKYGRFVTLLSIAARSGVNLNSPHYTAAKDGVLALTQQAALDLGRYGITINAVAPANVLTPRTLSIRSLERIAHLEKNQAGGTTRPARRNCRGDSVPSASRSVLHHGRHAGCEQCRYDDISVLLY